jgi:hypothetical protein
MASTSNDDAHEASGPVVVRTTDDDLARKEAEEKVRARRERFRESERAAWDVEHVVGIEFLRVLRDHEEWTDDAVAKVDETHARNGLAVMPEATRRHDGQKLAVTFDLAWTWEEARAMRRSQKATLPSKGVPSVARNWDEACLEELKRMRDRVALVCAGVMIIAREQYPNGAPGGLRVQGTVRASVVNPAQYSVTVTTYTRIAREQA